MSGFNTHEGRMARRVVDCFTTDALRQIQSAVNGDEYVNEYRGGMGSDIRYLSDFAVEQINNAVTVNGGGGVLMSLR